MIHSPRLSRKGLALLLVLALLLPAAGLAQEAETDTATRKHWWDLDRAHRCGRMWCSRVVSPHIPLAPGDR